MKRILTAVSIIVFFASICLAGDAGPVKVSPQDKCPICGMFVAKYPDFVAEIIFKDKSYAVFDGAKDMFKYHFNINKYNPGKGLADIDSVYVTDYYDLKPIYASKAFYVHGSNVYGPMGNELIPFEKESDAKEFVIDHAGKSILKFEAVTPDLVKSLD